MDEQLGLVFPGVEHLRTATLSDCGKYRYELTRVWAEGPLLEWVMLNPSTADANVDDPTIRRCIGFAKAWGFNGIRVTNLFAYRATEPDALFEVPDPFGPDNAKYLAEEHGPITVCGWGAHRAAMGDLHSWSELASRSALMCLGYNKDGSPKHPLYVPASAGLRPWPKVNPKDRHY